MSTCQLERAALRVDEHVLRLEVAVEDAVRVAPVEPSDHLVRERLRAGRGGGGVECGLRHCSTVALAGRRRERALMQAALNLYCSDFMYFLRS